MNPSFERQWWFRDETPEETFSRHELKSLKQHLSVEPRPEIQKGDRVTVDGKEYIVQGTEYNNSWGGNEMMLRLAESIPTANPLADMMAVMNQTYTQVARNLGKTAQSLTDGLRPLQILFDEIAEMIVLRDGPCPKHPGHTVKADGLCSACRLEILYPNRHGGFVPRTSNGPLIPPNGLTSAINRNRRKPYKQGRTRN